MKTKRMIAAGLLLAAGTPLWAADALRDNAALAARAEAVFGKQAGQSFDAQAVKPSAAVPRTETVTVTLAPGKGAGTFVAPFAGTHGWFWKNRSQQPVTVTLSLTGFHKRLVRHGGQP